MKGEIQLDIGLNTRLAMPKSGNYTTQNNKNKPAFEGRINRELFELLKGQIKNDSEEKKLFDTVKTLYDTGSVDTIYGLWDDGLRAGIKARNKIIRPFEFEHLIKCPYLPGYNSSKYSERAFFDKFVKSTKEDFQKVEDSLIAEAGRVNSSWLNGRNPYRDLQDYKTLEVNDMMALKDSQRDKYLEEMKEMKNKLKGSNSKNTKELKEKFQKNYIDPWLEAMKKYRDKFETHYRTRSPKGEDYIAKIEELVVNV